MNTMFSGIIKRNTAFAWVGAITCLLLLIPFVAMQFTNAVSWGVLDFVVMGALLFGSGSLFVLAARKAPRKYWAAIAIVVAVVLVYIWAELAVGIFTDFGS